jgi:hypothetical protein
MKQTGRAFVCPIASDVKAVVEKSGELREELQRLRRDLSGCRLCPAGPRCRYWVDFEATVQQAIHEVALEWRS